MDGPLNRSYNIPNSMNMCMSCNTCKALQVARFSGFTNFQRLTQKAAFIASNLASFCTEIHRDQLSTYSLPRDIPKLSYDTILVGFGMANELEMAATVLHTNQPLKNSYSPGYKSVYMSTR